MKEHKKQRRISTKLDAVFVEQNAENLRIVKVQAILRGNHQRRHFKQIKARYNTVNEILSTEQSYCDSLGKRPCTFYIFFLSFIRLFGV
jgi:hypothetical protein